MEWQEQNQRVQMALVPGTLVLGDGVDAWDTFDDPEQAFLSLVAAHRSMEARARYGVATGGLLRSVEEWDLMMSCARAMARKGWDPSSLGGQDTLTYVTRLLQGLSAGATLSGEATARTRTANAPPPTLGAPEKPGGTASAAKDEDSFATPEATKRRAAKKARKRASRQAEKLKAQMQAPTQPPDSTNVVLHDAATWYNMTAGEGGAHLKADHS